LKTLILIQKSISYYRRYYKLVALAVAITVAVIVGSLMVGDSVRTTLVNRVSERLGNTETIIFSDYSYLSEQILEDDLFTESTRALLYTNGFISHSGRLIPVNIWGVSDMSIVKGGAKINASLANELAGAVSNYIVLRLPSEGLIPSGSIFVTDNYTTSLRLSNEGIVEAIEGGNLNLKNEHIIPLNIFVNREELAEQPGLEGKINMILSGRHITADELNNAWNHSYSGISIYQRESFTEIISDRVFIQEPVIKTIRTYNNEPNRLFSYLANTIEHNDESVPYSFITALDNYKGRNLEKDEAILSDYTAKRLNAAVGDTLQISYFVSHDFKTLITDSAQLVVKQIVPISELLADSTLSAKFPAPV